MATSTESSKHPSGYLVAPRVPQGLAAAVEGLTREVIRQRPEDIYVFAAHHFEKLLKLRQEYGTSGIPLEKDSRTLRDMGLGHLMIPKSGKDLTRARDTAEQSGWSVNQTAKVLKRHRSIVGDIGDSGDAFTIIRSRINNNESTKLSPIHKYNNNNNNTSDENYQKYTKRFNQRSWSIEDRLFCGTETKNTPKIITRIPSTGMLAKDIKTELRKNRISSHERRNSKYKPDEIQKIDINENNNYDIKSSSRKSSGQSGINNNQSRRRSSENLIESSGNRIIKTPSMDKVKDYVVNKFSTTQSIEELQTVKYVEKVQEIIDETGQIIKEKVDQLKNGIYIDKKSRSRSNSKNNLDIENNKFKESNCIEEKLNETKNVADNLSANIGKSNRRSKSARGLRRMKSVSTMSSEDSNVDNPDKNEELMISALLIENRKKDGLDTRLNETKNILEDIYSGFPKPIRYSRSEKGSRSNLSSDINSQKSEELETMLNETKNLLVGISSNFTERRRSRGSGNASSLSSKSDESDHAESQKNFEVSLPVVRPPSAKSKNHIKNDSESIILPAISPEVSKSALKKDEFSLPILSSPGTSTHEDSKLPDSADSVSRKKNINQVQIDEVFKDSLDVTPDPLDLPLRPDSLEPEEQDLTNDLKEKLLEIQEAEKNIEKIFTTDENKENNFEDPFKDKLIELMEVEKGIENILVDNELVENTEKNLIDKPNKVENLEILETKEEAKELEIKSPEIEENQKQDKDVSNKSVGELSNTYILSEESPTDIPETVTTVIIPDFPQTPDSDSLPIDFEIGDSEAAELLPGLSVTIEELDESIDAASIPVNLESLGEVVLPEDNPESSVDFVSPMDELIIIPKKDLQSINEDVLHEEEISENNNPLISKLNSPKDININEDESGNPISTSRIDTSDISNDLTGIDNTSTLSTSAKETTVTDEQIELSKKLEISAENEELSSDIVSAESTNEAKETTVTDGTSFSLDPMRPFVPELNLDSLQEITVSSFKMTEDGNEDPGEIDQENTTSITETLTPDEHKKITTTSREEDEELNIFEFSDADLVVDVESEITETEKLSLNESSDNLIAPEVIEKPCIKEYVEIVEPPFEKEIVKLMEPNIDDENLVPDNLPDQIIDLKSDNNDNEDKIIDNSLEKTSESDQGTEETEDNFIDEDTPLAVSRSASQCTTRRVSSGNLARLKEEQRLDEGEELEMTDESIKDKSITPPLKEEIKLNDSLDNTVIDESNEFNDLVSVGNSIDDVSNENTLEETRKYHIHVPELDQTKDTTATTIATTTTTTTTTATESSFNSAATKIQAGVRGFLTRRGFQRMHHLNSTLNSVPSIQDSIVVDENSSYILELQDAARKIQSNFRSYKARQRLKREDAMQKTTISMERAFGNNGICHTSEFHDCIPLPLFDFMKSDDNDIQNNNLMTNKFDDIVLEENLDKKKNKQKELGMMFEILPSTPVVQFGITPKLNKLVDLVVINKNESTVQNSYLNFITSVEDTECNPNLPVDQINNSLVEDNTQESIEFSPRKGVIIEEITSLEEAKILQEIKESSKVQSNEKLETKNIENIQVNNELILEKINNDKVNEIINDFKLNLEKKLDNKLSQYESEDYSVSHDTTLTLSNPTKSLSLSQESQLAGERIESPITMMQNVPPTRSESLVRDDSSDMPSSYDEKQHESIKDQTKLLKLKTDENLKKETTTISDKIL